MIQFDLFKRVEAAPKRQQITSLPRRLTWCEVIGGGAYRGIPWHYGLGLWRVFITHSPVGYDLGWCRFVEESHVLAIGSRSTVFGRGRGAA